MNGTIIGFRNYDFKDKNSGRQVTGTSLFVAYEKNGFQGQVARKLSLSENRIIDSGLEIYVGAPIVINFDDEGKVDSVYNG